MADVKPLAPDRDHERDRDRDRDRPPPVAIPRVRDPRRQTVSPPRRQSLTEKLRSSWGGMKPQNSINRRASTSASSPTLKSSPVSRIRGWVDQCTSEHGRHCHGGHEVDGLPTFRPVWLIDCVEYRLIRAHPDDPYTALSYVYEPPGRTPHLVTQAANVERHEKEIPQDDLPTTITDAIWLTRKLGTRFLWVDRLCIVQDDEAEKQEHVRNMAFIFANAHLVIVAAGPHANSGLSGLERLPPGGPKPKGAGKTHQDLVAASKWNTRAWTVQEALYARRAVYIFEDTLTWECHCETWTDSTQTSKLKMLRAQSRPRCALRLGPPHLAFQHSPWPDMDDYSRIVMDYTSRRLTFVEDTTKAFAGITNVLSKVFAGGFVWGLPVMFLDVALLWQPQTSIRRKILPQGVSQQNCLPSWSWMGWWFDDLPVELLLWRAAADYVETSPLVKRGANARRFQSPSHFRLRRPVAFSMTDRVTTTPLVSNGLQYRGRAFRSTNMPPGWAKDGYDYKHDSDRLTLFRYPIPISPTTGPEQLLAVPPPPGSCLSFTTSRGFFDVEINIKKGVRNRDNPPLSIGNIYSRNNRWVGQFRSHDTWIGIQSSNYDGDEKLEFVAISEATERDSSHVFEDEFLKEPGVVGEGGLVEFVNVLWVERIGGVCYRRGLGHIIARAWDAQARETVDVLLG